MSSKAGIMGPKTMLAWQKHFPHKTFVRVEVPVPAPTEDEILVKIHAAGVCHSDVALRDAEQMPPEFAPGLSKFTAGHEGCGRVVATGPEVTKFNVGDMVAMIIVPGCGSESCAQCSAGVPQVCQRSARYGGGHDGFYAPYAKVSERAAAILPPKVSTAAGAVATDACMTAYHAVMNRAQVRKDEVVLVVGLGGLGFNGVQIALHQGARVVVFDTRPMVLEEAKKIGIRPEDVIPHDTADIGAWLGQKGMIIDKVIDLVGMPNTFRAAVDCVRIGGTIVIVGLLSPELSFLSPRVVRRQITIMGSYAGTLSDLTACLNLIADGHLVPQVAQADMDDLPQILEDLHAGKIQGRVALVPKAAEG